jgi:hypothetical protein
MCPAWLWCRGNVGDILDQKDQRGVKAALLRDLDLEQVRPARIPSSTELTLLNGVSFLCGRAVAARSCCMH